MDDNDVCYCCSHVRKQCLRCPRRPSIRPARAACLTRDAHLVHTQGKQVLKKPERKAKPVRGDQQKLRKGNLVIKPKIEKKSSDYRANAELTKKITARIEQTMAARAATDGAGLHVVSSEDTGKYKPLRAPIGSKR